MIGEIFSGFDFLDLPDPERSRQPEFRMRLFEALWKTTFEKLERLDGEYLLVHWDAEARALTLANDRFGGLPVYWSHSPLGTAIAGGVRGVLVAPGITAEPDAQALRESVTFGGFRLADRTNVSGIKMLPGGTVLTLRNRAVEKRRYWGFGDIPPRSAKPVDQIIDEAAELWQKAIRRRLGKCDRLGQTLSGGLDSRAILGEASHRTTDWVAITYGIPGCDDARLAERAAKAAGARWRFVDVYRRPNDWLSSRDRHIQATDGLIALGDLMHVDTVHVQAEEMHVHLSGYIGDAICGPTFADIASVDDLYRTLPYYGTGLGMSGGEAHERLLSLVAELEGAHVRFVVYDNKLPQSTNRWTAAWRPWIRVRKPFLDYELVDFWLGIPNRLRGEERLYERFLVTCYPRLFEKIPNQRTGVPVLAPTWHLHSARVKRLFQRKLRALMGLPVQPRSYHDDRGRSRGAIQAQIEETILRRGSLCCEILGREKVSAVVRAWFDHNRAPAQVIGALYVYERYHQDLPSLLRAAGRGSEGG
jgi:asparagine synthase (glutamine-hydrolysing)